MPDEQASKTQAPPPDADAPDPLLQQYLAERNEPCPRCGYNLRALRNEYCPECGDRLRLKVGLVEPRLAAYVTSLVFAAIGFGGSFFFSGIAAIYAPSDWWIETISGPLLILLLLVAGPAVLLLAVLRRHFTRRPTAVQWAITATLALYVIFSFILIVGFFED